MSLFSDINTRDVGRNQRSCGAATKDKISRQLESQLTHQREVQRQRAVFSALHVLGFQGSRKVSKTTNTIKVIAFCSAV